MSYKYYIFIFVVIGILSYFLYNILWLFFTLKEWIGV